MFGSLESYMLNSDSTLTKDLHYHEMVLHECLMKQDRQSPIFN